MSSASEDGFDFQPGDLLSMSDGDDPDVVVIARYRDIDEGTAIYATKWLSSHDASNIPVSSVHRRAEKVGFDSDWA